MLEPRSSFHFWHVIAYRIEQAALQGLPWRRELAVRPRLGLTEQADRKPTLVSAKPPSLRLLQWASL